MATLSQRRKTALAADAEIVHRLYKAACARFGIDDVRRIPSLLWTMRCMLGMDDQIPWDAMESDTPLPLKWRGFLEVS